LVGRPALAVQAGRDRELTVSYAGLTRVSIHLRKGDAKGMDGRVKPGHDDLA
jgi:hypothetical protein